MASESPQAGASPGLLRKGPAFRKAAFAVNLAASLILGLVFIWAAVQKIRDPGGTLDAVLSYRVLPVALAPGVAIILPWLEFWAGIFTVTGPGYFRRAGALILSGLLALFIVFTAFNLARGLDFECGCFGAGSGRPGALFFLRDAALLALGLEIVFHRKIFGRIRRPAFLSGRTGLPAGPAAPPDGSGTASPGEPSGKPSGTSAPGGPSGTASPGVPSGYSG
ncbi:MAG: hypothetical protein LBW85_14500 [Deltaproteobacteria bacterium]|jgi:hypothetical protein|nr:hypothetical protein [Deltaproteobacteria bacterium]